MSRYRAVEREDDELGIRDAVIEYGLKSWEAGWDQCSAETEAAIKQWQAGRRSVG